MGEVLRDVAIGLAVLFLGFAGLVTLVLEGASRVFGWRAANLWTWVRKTVDPQADKDAIKADSAQWLVGKSATGVGTAASLNSKKVEAAVRDLLVLPSKRINSIPSRDFGRAVVGLVVGDDKGTSTLDNMVKAVAEWDDKIPIKSALLRILKEAEGKREVLVDRVGDWFDEQMSRVSALYRRNMKVLALVAGLGLAVVFNLNALNAFDVLNSDATLRSAGATAGQAIAKDCADKTGDAARQCAEKLSKSLFNSNELVEAWGLFDGDDHGRRFQRGPVFPLVGVGLSAAAIALGAPFWLDALKRLTTRKTAQEL